MLELWRLRSPGPSQGACRVAHASQPWGYDRDSSEGAQRPARPRATGRQRSGSRCRRLHPRRTSGARASWGPFYRVTMPVLRMVDGVLPGRRRPALEGEELLDGPVVVEELDEAAVRQPQRFAVDVGPRPFGGLVGGALLAHEVRPHATGEVITHDLGHPVFTRHGRHLHRFVDGRVGRLPFGDATQLRLRTVGACDRDSVAILAATARGVDEGEVPHAWLRWDANAPLDHDGVDDFPCDESVEVVAKFRAVLGREDHGVPLAFEVQELAVDARV